MQRDCYYITVIKSLASYTAFLPARSKARWVVSSLAFSVWTRRGVQTARRDSSPCWSTRSKRSEVEFSASPHFFFFSGADASSLQTATTARA